MILLLALLAQDVRSGLDVLSRDGFAPLKGRRVGLVTNHSAIDRNRAHLIDLVAAAKDVKLVALFSPEHGIRGAADTNVASGRDEKTGLPIHSLYGKTRKPSPETLEGVELLVFDIQDIGTRYYTYISTLALVMEAAKERGKKLLVLDRPNPIGGELVEGPIQDAELVGQFISHYPMPTRHGLTVGEIARLFNADPKMACELDVVRVEGWKRSMYFDETGLPWVNPSPNMRSLPAAIAYPGLGALEGTSLSVGRGTGRAFTLYGAPWVESAKLCADLNARRLPGVRFKETAFTPRLEAGFPKYPHTDQECRGFELEIADRRAFRPVNTTLHVLDALHRLHPREFTFSKASSMIGRASIEAAIKAGTAPDQIQAGWLEETRAWDLARTKFTLY